MVPLIVLTLGVGVGTSAQDATPVVTTRTLSGSVHLLTTTDARGPTNSLVSVGADGTVLVDHVGNWRTFGVPGAVVSRLREGWRGLEGPDPSIVINTHWHGDHTAGNVVYGAGARIVAHRNTRVRLSARQTPWWFPEGIGPMEPVGWPDVTFTDSMTLFANGQTISLWHFGPAHTDGDAVVYFSPADVVHLGDLYHGPDDPSVGEDMDGLLRTLEAVLVRVPARTQVVAGHGAVTTTGDLRQYADMLRETIAFVREALAAGDDLARVQARGLPARWRDVMTAPESVTMWLDAIHRSLTGG